MKYGFGIDVGGTTVKLAYFDQEGNMLDKWEIPSVTADNGKQILPDIANSVQNYLKEHNIPREQIIGLGIVVPGPVNDVGDVNCCVNLGWGKFNIHETLKELTGFPVVAGNDATVAAVGECWKGGGQGYQNMVFVTLGTGVGGGIVIGGKAVHGAHGAGAEIGHIVINRDETEACGCGKRGCVEQYCSATGIVRIAKQFLAKSDRASEMRGVEKLTAKDIFDAAANGDILATEALEQVYAYMGEFLANVCCVADPDMVVFGGGVSNAGEPLLEGVKKYFEHYAFHACRETKFALATLGNDAGAYGAFKLILTEYGE